MPIKPVLWTKKVYNTGYNQWNWLNTDSIHSIAMDTYVVIIYRGHCIGSIEYNKFIDYKYTYDL
jgi:hypothetical protein